MQKVDSNLEEEIKQLIRKELEFTARKLADTPTDNLQVVNRKYVTLNGSVAGRPNSSVATVGQVYVATDTGIPMWFTPAGWRNGVGSIVAGL